MAFGERLQREREMRGITLEEISKATRIGTRSLRALEQEDFGKLPGGIFNKGFVRAYARYLGIDEEQAVIDYIAALGEPDDPALDSERLKKLEANWKPPRRNRLGIDPYFRIPWRGLALIAGFVVVVALGWHFRNGPLDPIRLLQALRAAAPARLVAPTAQPVPASTQAAAPVEVLKSEPAASPLPPAPLPATAQPIPEPTPKPEAKATTVAAKAKPEPTAAQSGSSKLGKDAFSLRVYARKQSWVTIEADGQTKVSRMLEAGQFRSVPASSRIRLVVGDPASVDVYWNERKQPSLGRAGAPSVVYFTPAGLQADTR